VGLLLNGVLELVGRLVSSPVYFRTCPTLLTHPLAKRSWSRRTGQQPPRRAWLDQRAQEPWCRWRGVGFDGTESEEEIGVMVINLYEFEEVGEWGKEETRVWVLGWNGFRNESLYDAAVVLMHYCIR
jgi:hypothetical protein